MLGEKALEQAEKALDHQDAMRDSLHDIKTAQEVCSAAERALVQALALRASNKGHVGRSSLYKFYIYVQTKKMESERPL